MAKRFVDNAAKEAFTRAIRTIESESAVEIVVKVRHHSGSYLHADLLAGVAAAVLSLAYMLFSTAHHFSSTALLIDPLLIGVGIGLFTTQVPLIRRTLTRKRSRHERVRQAAEAAFFRRGVHHTSQKIGILVYASLLEQIVELVCDQGVVDALADGEIDTERARLTRALATSETGAELAAAIASLKTVCAARLPIDEHDVNELPDQVYFHP